MHFITAYTIMLLVIEIYRYVNKEHIYMLIRHYNFFFNVHIYSVINLAARSLFYEDMFFILYIILMLDFPLTQKTWKGLICIRKKYWRRIIIVWIFDCVDINFIYWEIVLISRKIICYFLSSLTVSCPLARIHFNGTSFR